MAFDTNSTAASGAASLGPLNDRAIKDAIRGVYDLGYRDGVHGGASAARQVERDHGGALIHALSQALAVPAGDLESLRGKVSRIGLDIDRALAGEVVEQSPVAGRLKQIAALARAAAPAAPAAPPDLRTVVNFLCGNGMLFGRWFFDGPPAGEKDRYWWRKHLRASFAASTVTVTASAAAPQAPDAPWDASHIKQPGWHHVQQAFIDGAREARANPDAADPDFGRASDGYTKRIFEIVDPVSEEALRTESWISEWAPAAPTAAAAPDYPGEDVAERKAALQRMFWTAPVEVMLQQIAALEKSAPGAAALLRSHYAAQAPAAGAAPSQHITQPYTVAEIRERVASGDYNAELMLQHALLHLGAGAAPSQDEEKSQPWYDLAWKHGAKQHASMAGDGWMPIETAPDGERVLLGPRHAPVVGTVHQPAHWHEEQEPTVSVVHYNGTTLVAGYRCSEWHRLPGAGRARQEGAQHDR